jgi:hypothetical protein
MKTQKTVAERSAESELIALPEKIGLVDCFQEFI